MRGRRAAGLTGIKGVGLLRRSGVESSACPGGPAFYPFSMETLVKLVQRVGPYVVTAIVVPGGTFVVLALYLFRRYRGTSMGGEDEVRGPAP